MQLRCLLCDCCVLVIGGYLLKRAYISIDLKWDPRYISEQNKPKYEEGLYSGSLRGISSFKPNKHALPLSTCTSKLQFNCQVPELLYKRTTPGNDNVQ